MKRINTHKNQWHKNTCINIFIQSTAKHKYTHKHARTNTYAQDRAHARTHACTQVHTYTHAAVKDTDNRLYWFEKAR